MSNPFSFDDDEKPKKKSAVRKRGDDDEEDERPRKKARPRDDDDEDEDDVKPKKKAKSRVDDDDDEDERPKKKAKSQVDDDDDDDDEDDRPKKKKFKKKKSNKGLIIGLSVGGLVLVLLVCCGLGAFLIWGREGGPKEGFEKMQKAAEAGDWGTVYDRMDNDGRAMMSGFMELAKSDPVKGPALKGKSGRELFVAVMKESKKEGKGMGNDFPKGTVEKVDQKGDTATVFVKSGGKTEEIPMIKQDGTWRLNVGKGFGSMK